MHIGNKYAYWGKQLLPAQAHLQCMESTVKCADICCLAFCFGESLTQVLMINTPFKCTHECQIPAKTCSVACFTWFGITTSESVKNEVGDPSVKWNVKRDSESACVFLIPQESGWCGLDFPTSVSSHNKETSGAWEMPRSAKDTTQRKPRLKHQALKLQNNSNPSVDI